MSDKIDRSDAEWRERLTPEQYEVTRRKATEPAFSGEYNDCKDSGTYRCVCCGEELFSAGDKYDSGSGWPSFVRPVTTDKVCTAADDSHGVRRVEVLCNACGAHLGHVFDDGPGAAGKRYCINSLALDLDRDRDPDD